MADEVPVLLLVAEIDVAARAAGRTRFAEVASSLSAAGKLLGSWAIGRSGAAARYVVPEPIRARAKKVALRVATRVARARDTA